MSAAKTLKLSADELNELIDRTARKRLKISGDEFMKLYQERNLEDSPAVRDILMLVRFGKEKDLAGKANPAIHKLSKQRFKQDRNRRTVDAA